jgi:hypothetical protein
MPRVFTNATIAAGQSLSTSVDCRNGAPVLLFMPMAWTSARISYQLSNDGTNFWDLFDRTSREIAVNVRAGTVVRFNPEWTDSALGCWIKIRSGSCDGPIVAQESSRVFTILINTSAQALQAEEH